MKKNINEFIQNKEYETAEKLLRNLYQKKEINYLELHQLAFLNIIKSNDNEGNQIDLVISRTCEIKIIDDKTKTIWYYSESGFPTYMAISIYRKRNPSYEHCIASKECWKRLCETNNPMKL